MNGTATTATAGEVAVTGVGLVTAYGFGVERYWRGLLSASTALAPARRFDHAEDAWVGEVPAPADDAGRQAYADAAALEALRDAGFPAPPDGCLVVTVGQTGALTDAARATGADLVAPEVPAPAGVTFALGGAHVLSHACASAAFAVAFARELLAAGVAPAALVVGATVLNREEYASMRAVRAVSPHRAKPLDRRRDGISLGEGGGAVVLEPVERAAARGARTDVRVSGAACRVAGKGNAAASDHDVLADCVDTALGEAQVSDVDYVHAHATGTTQGDAAELAVLDALAERLGATSVPVSSHKGAVGHLLHASAFPALAAAVRALRTATLPPTPGLDEPEPAERLRLLRAPLTLPAVRSVLLTSAGFGGNNAALVLTRRRADQPGRPTGSGGRG